MPYAGLAANYVSGQELDGSSIRADHDALRRYLNRDIVLADLAADEIGWQEVLEPQPIYPLASDTRFQSWYSFGNIERAIEETQVEEQQEVETEQLTPQVKEESLFGFLFREDE